MNYVDFGKITGDSFGYAKESLVGHWGKWILLIILALLPAIPIVFGIVLGVVAIFTAPSMVIPTIIIMIILAIILALPLLGYTVQVYRGETPAPEVQNWGSLFSNGLKLFVVYLIYAIPVLILAAVVLGSALWTIFLSAGQSMANPNELMGLFGAVMFGVLILALVALIIWLIEATAIVRFARTNSISEAFNFSEIFAHISKTGVGAYIVALIIMGLIVGIITFVLNIIPYIGPVILLIVMPVIILFQARFLCLLYDSAGEAAPPA